jgi:hypothetical protein
MGNFSPDAFEVSAVTNALQAVVTTTADHGYQVGWYVMLFVPDDHGMDIPFEQVLIVDVPASDQFTIDLDTRNYSPFVAPVVRWKQVAQVMPISGEFSDVETR